MISSLVSLLLLFFSFLFFSFFFFWRMLFNFISLILSMDSFWWIVIEEYCKIIIEYCKKIMKYIPIQINTWLCSAPIWKVCFNLLMSLNSVLSPHRTSSAKHTIMPICLLPIVHMKTPWFNCEGDVSNLMASYHPQGCKYTFLIPIFNFLLAFNSFSLQEGNFKVKKKVAYDATCKSKTFSWVSGTIHSEILLFFIIYSA